MNTIILNIGSIEFIIGVFTGILSGFSLGYFIYLNKGDNKHEN